MLFNFASLLLLPATIRFALGQNSSSSPCNNSPSLCNVPYNQVVHLGAHDSPFLRNAETSFTISGNQFYNTSVQLSAGVRLLTAQVHRQNGQLRLCHSSCTFLDAGLFSDWLDEVRSWLESNPNDVVTLLIVNSDQASASNLARQYEAAGIKDLVYIPSGSDSSSQTWPTLQSLINDGTRLLNFVDSGVDDNSAAPYLMPEFNYIFENPYDVTTLSGFQCGANRPSKFIDSTSEAISNSVMPLMNHFLYLDEGLGIQVPAVDNTTHTNAPSGGLGSLGHHATQCTQEYGRAPTYVLVDYFNVGPAIATVDRLNGVTNPIGRTKVSKKIMTSTANDGVCMSWRLLSGCFAGLLACFMW